MKKVILGLVLVTLMVGTALAVKPAGPSAVNGLNGKGKAEHLYFYEKDQITWDPVPGGAWGKMRFDCDSFVFNGHGLLQYEDYTLVYYPDPWPGNGLKCLGEGTSNEYGDLHIMNGFDFSSIPLEDDENHPYAKMWLVLSDDVDCDEDHRMEGWNGEEYLFEYNTFNLGMYCLSE